MPDGIKDAVLIYNPTSGRKRHRRFVEIEQAARILKDAGIATELAPTTGPTSATQIARQAVEQRRGMVIACGGDGTINEIVNGLAGSQVPDGAAARGHGEYSREGAAAFHGISRTPRALIPGGTIRRIALGIAFPLNGNASEAMPRTGPLFSFGRRRGAGRRDRQRRAQRTEGQRRRRRLLGRGRAAAFRLRLPRNARAIRRAGAQGDDPDRRAHRELRRPVQDHHGRESLRKFVRVSDEFAQEPPGYLACLPAIWMGTLREMDGIEAWKSAATIMEPAGSDPVFAQVDGEPVGQLPIEFKIVPDALSIIEPASR